MKFSIWTSYERTWDEVLNVARFLDTNDWHALWYADHFMPQTDDNTPSQEPALECWTVLAGIAAAVPHIRLTSMVSPLTIHHPVVLAKRVTTVDQISGGRTVLGIGAGWQVNEHDAFGFELPAPGERVSRFAEGIEVIHHLLRDHRTNFEGRYYTLTDAPFEPKPVQTPLPILVGTGSPRMLRLTAKWADEWNTWGDPTIVADRTQIFLQACAAVGRDPATIRRSAQAMVFFADSDATRDAIRAKAPEGRSLVGGPNELIDLIGQYVEQGVDEFAIPDFSLGKSPERRMAAYERLQAEVLPAFR
jgi:alkanesulfonate monooxygenase SsuD/methylene tetrahydromethanopterin reductase-like flavin-dependent oxidoreductase (luciferase family)